MFTPLTPITPLSPVSWLQGVETVDNICLILGNDGIVDWYGFRLNAFGSSSVSEAVGVPFYAFQYKSTGETELRFGDDGTTQLDDIYEVLVTNEYGTYSNVLNWDATAECYITTDVNAAQYLMTQTDVCLGMYALPTQFINYKFDRIEIMANGKVTKKETEALKSLFPKDKK